MAQRTATIDIDSTRSAARRYKEAGWVPIAYQHQTKAPLEKNWQKKTLEKVDVDKAFTGNSSNVGVLLGTPSGNLVDVDLDSAEAIALAAEFLPPTAARFGRPATPDAHWLYRAVVPATVPFTYNGKRDGMLVELRSTGGQTMFPPSVHPSGERLSWTEEGQPFEIDGEFLLQCVRCLALASLIMRHWQDGLRNVLGLRVPGALLTHGWTEAEVEKLVRKVATKCGDDAGAIEKSVKRVSATAKRLGDKQKACTGIPKLAESLNINPDTLRSWVDMRPEEERGIFPTSEPIFIARQFAKTLDDVWHWRGDFYRWTGSWWVQMDDEELRGRLYPWLEKIRVLEKGKPVPFKSTRNAVGDILAALAGVRQLHNATEPPFWIDATSNDPAPADLLPFKNGTLDLRTYVLLPPQQRLFALHGVECNYDPAATAPVWNKFMRDGFPDDPKSIECIAEIFGYCMTGDTSQQKAFAFIGEKRSGKGTTGRIARAAVGAGRYANPKLSDFGETFGMQNLIGKSLAVISDARGQGRSNPHAAVENILTITGEDPVSIHRKYKSDWNGVLNTRIIMMANTIPKLKDASGVIVTRFIVIEFRESFYGRENPNLTSELLAELPGIINVWIEGLKRLRARGRFEQPESGQELLDLMDENTGPVKRFVEEMCTVGPDHTISKKLFNMELNEWLRDHGHYAMADETIGTDLYALQLGIRATKPRLEGKHVPHYAGITLTEMVPKGGKLTPNQAAMLYRDSGEMPPGDMIDPKIPF
ncbi:phage/plasmid primase, P4 family [Mesorhizobium sp. M0663]|uniref:phage/plasmid primase, P4 family n=1 Tax=Mesorhizobium sp. M0663 TaxID=2956981 RepID=UPI00333898AF